MKLKYFKYKRTKSYKVFRETRFYESQILLFGKSLSARASNFMNTWFKIISPNDDYYVPRTGMYQSGNGHLPYITY